MDEPIILPQISASLLSSDQSGAYHPDESGVFTAQNHGGGSDVQRHSDEEGTEEAEEEAVREAECPTRS
jgi:hypothetical protein